VKPSIRSLGDILHTARPYLPARYEEMSGQDLLKRVLEDEPQQLTFEEGTGT